MIVILGILILGAVILATFLLGAFGEKTEQITDLNDVAEGTFDNFLNNLGSSPEGSFPQEPTPTPTPYNLTLTPNNPSFGSGNTSGSYQAGSLVTVIATPNAGYSFDNWTVTSTGVVASSSASYSFTMPSNNLALTANFSSTTTPPTYTLSITKTGNGTVTSNIPGIDCGTDCSESYSSVTNVTLNAVPLSGYTFNGWSGECTGVSPSCVVTVDEVKNVVANFIALNYYSLDVIKTGNGTVTSNIPGIDCGTDCSESYIDSTELILLATPTSTSLFGGWSGDGCSGNTPNCSVTMDQARNISAEFIDTSSAFISEWDTRNSDAWSTGINQIKLPLERNGSYNFIIDWGDGSVSTITSYNDPDVVHTYSTPGIYTLEMIGEINGFRFNGSGDKLKIIRINQWGNLGLGNNGHYFSGAENLRVYATDHPDLNGITNLAGMFEGKISCSVSNPGNQPLYYNTTINDWDVSNVTNMSEMFACTSFSKPLSNWDVSNVTNMKKMFYYNYSFNQDISSWDVSNVTDMSEMFMCWFSVNDLCFDQDISSWDVSNVTDMTRMFYHALSPTNYSKILIGWSSLRNLESKVNLGAEYVKYYDHALSSRNILINNFNWTINDDGSAGVEP